MRHAETIRQFIGDLQVLLVCPQSHVFRFDLGKGLEQLLLISLGKGLVGHTEQAVIFLLDVLTEQFDVGTGVFGKLFGAVESPASRAASASLIPATSRRPSSCSRRITPVGPQSREYPLASIAGKKCDSSLPWWQILQPRIARISTNEGGSRPDIADDLSAHTHRPILHPAVLIRADSCYLWLSFLQRWGHCDFPLKRDGVPAVVDFAAPLVHIQGLTTLHS